mgnify:CR=1 FL=1
MTLPPRPWRLPPSDDDAPLPVLRGRREVRLAMAKLDARAGDSLAQWRNLAEAGRLDRLIHDRETGDGRGLATERGGVLRTSQHDLPTGWRHLARPLCVIGPNLQPPSLGAYRGDRGPPMTLKTRPKWMRQAMAAKAGHPKAHPLVQAMTRARVEAGLTVPEMMAISGWSKGAIAGMEQGRRKCVNLAVWADLCEAAGMDVVLVPRAGARKAVQAPEPVSE